MQGSLTSKPPAAPSPCPIRDLVEFILMCEVSLNTPLTAFTSAMSPTRVLQTEHSCNGYGLNKATPGQACMCRATAS